MWEGISASQQFLTLKPLSWQRNEGEWKCQVTFLGTDHVHETKLLSFNLQNFNKSSLCSGLDWKTPARSYSKFRRASVTPYPFGWIILHKPYRDRHILVLIFPWLFKLHLFFCLIKVGRHSYNFLFFKVFLKIGWRKKTYGKMWGC